MDLGIVPAIRNSSPECDHPITDKCAVHTLKGFQLKQVAFYALLAWLPAAGRLSCHKSVMVSRGALCAA